MAQTAPEPNANAYGLGTGSLYSQDPFELPYLYEARVRGELNLDKYRKDLMASSALAQEIARREAMNSYMGNLTAGRDSISDYASKLFTVGREATGIDLQPGELQGIMDFGRSYAPVVENVGTSAAAAAHLADAGLVMPGGVGPGALATGELGAIFSPGSIGLGGGGRGNGGGSGGSGDVFSGRGKFAVDATTGKLTFTIEDATVAEALSEQAKLGALANQRVTIMALEGDPQLAGNIGYFKNDADQSIVVYDKATNVVGGLINPDGSWTAAGEAGNPAGGVAP